MPLYDFRCGKCRHTFEALVRINSDGGGFLPPSECPKCGAKNLDRLPSVFAASSAEKRQASASAKVRKDAKQGHRDNIDTEREAEEHRREDH